MVSGGPPWVLSSSVLVLSSWVWVTHCFFMGGSDSATVSRCLFSETGVCISGVAAVEFMVVLTSLL